MYMSRSLMTECVRPNLAIRSRSSMCFEGRNVVLEQAGSRSRFREEADTANDAEVVSFRASSLVSAECADRMCFLKIFSDSEVKSQNRQSSSTSSSTSLCLWSLFLSSPLAFVTRTLLDLPMLSSDLALTPSTCFDLVRLFGILWSSDLKHMISRYFTMIFSPC